MVASNPPALFGQSPLGTGYLEDTHSEMHGRTLGVWENFLAYGAVGDGVEITDFATTNTSTTVSTPSGNFSSADIGKSMTIAGAGAAGAALNGTILSITNGTTVVLSAAAGATTSGKGGNYGTDNSPAFTAMLAASTATTGNHYFIPFGKYKFATTVAFNSRQYQKFIGSGDGRTLLMAPGNAPMFTCSTGQNQTLRFEDFRIAGPQENPAGIVTTDPRSTGFLFSNGDNNDWMMERVSFRDLAYALDDGGAVVSIIYLRFRNCGFDNAPLRWTGAAAHNANKFEACRWFGTRQSKPTVRIENAGTSAVNNAFRDCVWEGNNREAAVLRTQTALVIENPYCEFNNDDGIVSLPIFNLGEGSEGILIDGGYYVAHNNNTGLDDVIFGSNSGTSTISHNVNIWNPAYTNYHTGAVDRATFPSLLESYAGSVVFGTSTAPFLSTRRFDVNQFNIGTGTTIKKFASGAVTVDPASINANTTGETDVTVTGAAVGDLVELIPPATLDAGIVVSSPSRVSADNTVKLRLGNVTGAPIDVASASWTYVWWDIT